jgi:LysR family transcriptional regulator, hca operon transcriptional activator
VSGDPGLEYLLLSEEPLEIYLPKDHPLAKRTAISLQEVARETFLSISGIMRHLGRPSALRPLSENERRKHQVKPSHEVDNLGGVMSLIVSASAVGAPAYPRQSLSSQCSHHSPPVAVSCQRSICPSVIREANNCPVLKLFLSRIKEHAMYRGTLSPSNWKDVTDEQYQS